MAKNVDADPPKTAKTGSDAQFRAVVKRLLDTPPMHKTGKPAPRSSKTATRRSRVKRGKDE